MRSLSNKKAYRSVEGKRVESASGHEKILMLYLAAKDRLKEMRYILNKESYEAQDYAGLREKNSKVRQICDFLIASIYVDGACQSNEFERLYQYVKANASHAFSHMDGEAVERAESAMDELIDIWKSLGG